MSLSLEEPQDLVWAAQCGGCGRLAIEGPYTPVWLAILRREGRLAKTVYLCGNDDCPANDIAGGKGERDVSGMLGRMREDVCQAQETQIRTGVTQRSVRPHLTPDELEALCDLTDRAHEAASHLRDRERADFTDGNDRSATISAQHAAELEDCLARLNDQEKT